MSDITQDVVASEEQVHEEATQSASPQKSSKIDDMAGKEPLHGEQKAPIKSNCGCNKSGRKMVYAIGTLWMDFGTDAVLDSFKFFMTGIKDIKDTQEASKVKPIPFPNPYDPYQLLGYLNGQERFGIPSNEFDSDRVIWILKHEETPVYAIRPGKSYNEYTYDILRQFLAPHDYYYYDEYDEASVYKEGDPEIGTKGANGKPIKAGDKKEEPQVGSRLLMVSIPGYIVGETRLYTGQVVPIIEPIPRAMYNWAQQELEAHVLELINEELQTNVDFQKRFHAKKQNDKFILDEVGEAKAIDLLTRFVNRIQHGELRNHGLTSRERALNYFTNNLYNLGLAILSEIVNGYDLKSISVEKSPNCRPHSDCQDVLIRFFDPENDQKAVKVYRQTIDVSKVIPVAIGDMRTWFESHV